MSAFATIRVKSQEDICYIRMHRPEAENTINGCMIKEFHEALDVCEVSARVVVVEGLPEVFCLGADFKEIEASFMQGKGEPQDPEPLYDLWQRLAGGPYVSVAHVRGKANAGGVGFVAACDVVLSEEKALFSLSELLFGLMPACVLPFLIRRIGFSRANYLTLTTAPLPARQALEWGLVDACETDSENLLRKHLLRLRRLDKTAIARYKRYRNQLDPAPALAKGKALAANLEVFSDRANLEKISLYASTGRFPWE